MYRFKRKLDVHINLPIVPLLLLQHITMETLICVSPTNQLLDNKQRMMTGVVLALTSLGLPLQQAPIT
jgi:hypothetical protein